MENIKKIQQYSKIYNIGMGLLYILCFCCFGVFILLGSSSRFSEMSSSDLIVLIFFTVFLVPFIIFHFILAFAIEKKSKVVYYANIVAVAFGFTGLLTVVPGVLILIRWIEKDVKDYYLKSNQQE